MRNPLRRHDTASTNSVHHHGADDPVITLTGEDVTAGLAGSWTVIDFWAPWCAPCRQLAPRFEAAATTHRGLRFARCSVDDNPQTAADFGVVSIPTLILIDPDGTARDRLVGVPSARELDAFLAQAHAPHHH